MRGAKPPVCVEFEIFARNEPRTFLTHWARSPQSPRKYVALISERLVGASAVIDCSHVSVKTIARAACMLLACC